jgi:hypothetical protein
VHSFVNFLTERGEFRRILPNLFYRCFNVHLEACIESAMASIPRSDDGSERKRFSLILPQKTS